MNDQTLSRRQLLQVGGAASLAVAATGPAAAQVAPRLDGRAILITGAASGFGNIAALLFARSGAKVIATMRGLPRPEAAVLAETARREQLDLHIVELDVLSDDSVAKAVAEAERLAGRGLDVVVNNAGIGLGGPVELQDMAATRLIFDTNVFGYQRVARAALPAMRARRSGLIVNVSSQLGRVMVPGMGLYSATKFAVESMSEQLAYELAPRGVEVTIIQPGGYPTAIWTKAQRETEALLQRADDAREVAYPELVAGMRRGGGGGTTDPADVPRAIAEIIAMPAGTRPLRRAVHPGARPQEPINRVSAEVQAAMLGRGPFKPWADAVLG